jgi:hypothetical protein
MFDFKNATFKPNVVRVELPEVNDFAFVREMAGTEADEYEAQQYEEGKAGTALKYFRAKLVVRTLCDESGSLIYTLDDIEKVAAIPSTMLKRLHAAAQKVNKLRATDIKELEKN